MDDGYVYTLVNEIWNFHNMIYYCFCYGCRLSLLAYGRVPTHHVRFSRNVLHMLYKEALYCVF